MVGKSMPLFRLEFPAEQGIRDVALHLRVY
jgi:hypothetical protein